MVKSTIYKGIEYVRLSAMPRADQELFQKTFNPHLYIKILIDEEIIHDCVQYKDYVNWYSQMFATGNTVITVPHDEIEQETILVH